VNGMTESHVPNAEFRARLEEEVARTFRRDAQFADQTGTPRSRRTRGLLLLLAGIVLGAGTEFSAGQVQNAQERTQLIEAATANRQLAAARAALTEEALKQARARFGTGVISRESMMATEADALQMRQQIERLDLESAEIQASSAPPRDELWAPLVGGRDFVSDRLKIEAAARQRALSVAEEQLRDVERQYRVGTMGAGAVASAEGDIRDARRDMALLAKRLDLRRRFLEEGLEPGAIARELKQFEVAAEIERMMTALLRAQKLAAQAKERMRIGEASEIDVKRAELEALELSFKIKALQSVRDIERKTEKKN
jgi:hypothetical protein